jgi:hypothetical protein
MRVGTLVAMLVVGIVVDDVLVQRIVHSGRVHSRRRRGGQHRTVAIKVMCCALKQ